MFIHGCFWYRHTCQMCNRIPKTRVGFWREKLERNEQRAAAIARRLRKDGWSVLVIWECQTKPSRLDGLAFRITGFLGEPGGVGI